MSFLSKLALVTKFIIERVEDSSKSYEIDARNTAKREEKKMNSVNYNRLSSEQKSNYDARMSRIEKLKNIDGRNFRDGCQKNARKLNDYIEKTSSEEDDY